MKFTRIVLSLIAVGLLYLITTVLVSHSRISNPNQPATDARASIAQGAGERGPVRMIRFVLWNDSIYPRSMRVNAGLVNLAIEDKTNMSEGLAVEQVVMGGGQKRLITVRRVRNHWRGRELLRLTPGQYVVYDVSKPDNKADLTVEQ
jgi:hypothetical protein